MSGGGGGVIIIQSLIDSGKFSVADCARLREIGDRSITRCTFGDALAVARIVFKGLRRP